MTGGMRDCKGDWLIEGAGRGEMEWGKGARETMRIRGKIVEQL